MNANSSVLFGPRSGYSTPFELLKHVLGEPAFHIYEKEKEDKKTGHVKRRRIANPNKASRDLHTLFLTALRRALVRMGDRGKLLRMLPSATAFKKGSSPIKNAKQHLYGEHFYVTDIRDAYGTVSLERLSALLVYIFRFEIYKKEFSYSEILDTTAELTLRDDPLYGEMLAFLKFYFSGERGRGLIFGGVASPYLFNLYLEASLDEPLRELFKNREPSSRITYTRFADDLVFSSRKIISSSIRKTIRQKVTNIDMEVHHRKSKVLARSMGTVFITKVGLHREDRRIVFPGEKRAALHNMLHQFFQGKTNHAHRDGTKDPANVIGGHIAEFLGHVAQIPSPTQADKKLLMLCKKFELVAGNRGKSHKRSGNP